ncbi:unnamed protein product [Durusdinium trenchii]
MVRRVDFNSNKTMDKDEFLRLMRLQRETTLGSYTAAYTKNRLYARNAAPPAEIQRVLEVAGHRPNVLILNQALQLVEDSSGRTPGAAVALLRGISEGGGFLPEDHPAGEPEIRALHPAGDRGSATVL